MEGREDSIDIEQTEVPKSEDTNDIAVVEKINEEELPSEDTTTVREEVFSPEEDTETVQEKDAHTDTSNNVDDSDHEVEQYYEKLQLIEEENNIENKFSLTAFNYSAKEFEIDINSYKVCGDSLEDNGYLFVTDKVDLLSKYFVDRLLQSLDPYGNKQREELLFNNGFNGTDKIDFLDLENYLSNFVDDKLLVLDLCKFGPIEKEYLLNSFYHYMQKGGNKVKFREMLNKKSITLILVAFENNLEGKDKLLNTYEVSTKSVLNDVTVESNEIENFLEQRSDEKMETDLLFISSIFKGVSPLELQELLNLVFDDDDQIRWKRHRKILLKNVHLHSQVSNGLGSVIEFDIALKGKEEEMMQRLREEDPFFISEFFDAFEKNTKLFTSTLLGNKSIALTNGFFTLVEANTIDDPSRLSLEWFGKKFSEGSSQNSINYFFSLASCALRVSSALDDNDYLDRLVDYFYKKNELWSLFYLVEYFSPIDFFDTFKWYKMILTSLDNSPEGRKLRTVIYRSIQKVIHEDPCKISIILSWTSENKTNLVNNSFYILMRLASDSVRTNRDWTIQDEMPIPSLFDLEDEKIFSECIEPYVEYLYRIPQKTVDIDVEVYNNAWSENINKLFFTKIVGLQRYYDIGKSEQQKIIKNLISNLAKLIGNKEKNFILLILLWLMEWNFILANASNKEKSLSYKRKLFSLLNDTLSKDEMRKLRSTILEMSTVLLKLSSLTRKHKELSSTYAMMRKLVREIQQDMNKKTINEGK